MGCFSNSFYSAFDTITDFQSADRFEIGHTVRASDFRSVSYAASGNLQADLNATLNSSNFAALGADLVTLTGPRADAGTYAVINNAGVAGFQPGGDAVIRLADGGGAYVSASSFIA